MAVKLGDIELAVPTAEVCAVIERDISLERIQLMFSRSWPGFGAVGLAYPTMFRPWPPLPVRLNRFYWPNGATRWESGLFLCSKDQAIDVQTRAFGANGLGTNKQSLVLSSEDPSGTLIEKITTDVTVFAPIPAYAVLNDDSSTDMGMYLLYVVGKRFHWWNYATPEFNITESGSQTWDDIINEIQTQLVETFDWPEFPSEYLSPSRALNLTNEPLPLVMDAVAWNVGCRWVVDYNGDVSLQNFKDALEADILDSEAFREIRTPRAGEVRFSDNL